MLDSNYGRFTYHMRDIFSHSLLLEKRRFRHCVLIVDPSGGKKVQQQRNTTQKSTFNGLQFFADNSGLSLFCSSIVAFQICEITRNSKKI